MRTERRTAAPKACRLWCLAVGLLAAGAAGCGQGEAATGTGAREAAQRYYEALRQHDWSTAHAALHPDSRARCNSAQFARLAARYRNDLGFEPEAVRVRFCDEQPTRAVAHVVYTGRARDRRRSYKDAVVLRPGATGWGVVLPRDFGQARPR